MHLIDKDPVPKGYKASSTPAVVPKKDSLATALKNKITKKVGGIMASPYVKVKESQMRQDDKNYAFLKGYNQREKNQTEISDKDRAVFKQIRDSK